MINSPRFQETHHNLSLIPSPNSSSSSSGSNGHHHQQPPPTLPRITSVPITRSEPNSPYPTSFVQADTTSFKQVVQMLTGYAETTKQASRPSAKPESRNHCIPPIKIGPKKEKSKLYERRNNLKNFKLNPLAPGLVNNNPGFSGGYSGSPRLIFKSSPSISNF